MQTVIEFIREYPDFAEFIGVIGFMLYVGGFFSVQSGFLCGNGIAFPILQVCAACCVLVSLSSAYNLPSFMIQTSYIAIGLFGIALRLSRVGGGHGPGGRAPASPAGPVDPEGDCHEPATLFRHRSAQSDSPNIPALCS
ncbi:hypothetical protein AAFO92_03050 [Roseovarius sp. CAU 1744]|uniref:CBU_0592 family membrane protein n=1 Tax=Roseovarius sp. CAU 1744 TaxID=3140368 RepID=UPI00325BBEA4